jgi:glycerol-3-phosphate dehydrogenase (NAD(P)+)
MTAVAVLGGGSWGTTLALLLLENGHRVTLWEFFAERAERLARERENRTFLPGVRLPDELRVTSSLEPAVAGAEWIVVALPAQTVRSAARALAATGVVGKETRVVSASKGLEVATMKRMSEILREELDLGPERVGVLVGPSHAEEVSRKMPASVVVAGGEGFDLESAQDLFMNEHFRVYRNNDLVGVEVAVALKNTVAIAAGICDGLDLGDNAKAALITRGLTEITRLGTALGALPETFWGLAGVGDLIATCASRHSRNRHLGEEIGRGKSLKETLEGMTQVAEGVTTTEAVIRAADRHDVELPITREVGRILFEDKDPRSALSDLMTRPPKEED